MENKPQIPTLHDGKEKEKESKPLLKLKGLSASGGSLIERLRQFKKKDLAFILAGLGVLFMAPLAEHFMMAPEGGDDSLKPGFSRGGGPLFGGGSPYETGVNGMAPGGIAGGGSDVITPLNVRDPSALVMGPGATQQAPAGVPQPSAPPPPKEDSSKWNDAVSAAKAGAKAAAKTGLPVPKVPLSAGGLRGLGAISGGSGSNFGLGPINSNGLAPNHAAQSHSLSGTNGSGFKGVARGPNTGAGGAFEQLKKNANQQGGDLNRGGNAQSALESAANRDMSGGAGGGAGQGGSKDDKNTGGNSGKDSKSPGESLEFLRQKMEMEKAIDLKWKLKEKAAMLWPNLKEKMLEEAVMTPLKAATSVVGSMIKSAGDPLAGKMNCTYNDGGPMKTPSACAGGDKDACVNTDGRVMSGGNPIGKCTKDDGSAGPSSTNAGPGVRGPQGDMCAQALQAAQITAPAGAVNQTGNVQAQAQAARARACSAAKGRMSGSDAAATAAKSACQACCSNASECQ